MEKMRVGFEVRRSSKIQFSPFGILANLSRRRRVIRRDVSSTLFRFWLRVGMVVLLKKWWLIDMRQRSERFDVCVLPLGNLDVLFTSHPFPRRVDLVMVPLVEFRRLRFLVLSFGGRGSSDKCGLGAEVEVTG
ncbi:hypothetical protein HID58_093932 [Brassica napus]|uniref:Uncharacterized protein n=1 Tax=Brassica napus TaxID=3708 RepID=A0ABQ7X9C1_BRANA|nr:hypothetical protein HID58_093932 [Brassica napus]